MVIRTVPNTKLSGRSECLERFPVNPYQQRSKKFATINLHVRMYEENLLSSFIEELKKMQLKVHGTTERKILITERFKVQEFIPSSMRFRGQQS